MSCQIAASDVADFERNLIDFNLAQMMVTCFMRKHATGRKS